MTKEEQQILKAFELLLRDDLKDSIEFTIDVKQKAPIRISLRGKLLPGESENYSRTISRLSSDFLNPKDQLTSRIAEDLTRSRRKKSKSGKTMSIVLVFNTNKEYIDTDFKDIKEFEEKSIKDLSAEQLARLLQEVYITWKNLPVEHRTPRSLTERAASGYLRLRENYTHREIVKAIVVYGRWAKAYAAALDAGEDKDIFWFYAWKFEQFLISPKAMAHLEDGWKVLARDKKIPFEYAKDPVEEKPESDEEIQARRLRQWNYVADDIIKYGSALNNDHIYEANKEAIDKIVEEKRSRAK